jgi:hypothetical protein
MTTLDDLRTLLRAITIYSPTALAFAGQPVAPLPATGSAENGRDNPLVTQLQHQLYQHAYTRRFDGTLHTPTGGTPADDMRDALSAANKSRERWEEGWQIAQVLPTGQVMAQRHGQTRPLWPGQFITQDGPQAPPRPGAAVSVFVPRESRTMQPGFYFAFGESAETFDDLSTALRFYWNVSAGGGPALVAAITTTLNQFDVPFRFKIASHRALFYRVDSAVLYVDRKHAAITTALLPTVIEAVHAFMQPETPLFTRRLAPGLAFAEEPGSGESFGMHRCRLVAEGVWAAYLKGAQTDTARLQAVQHQFEQQQLNFDRPYLRAGSVGYYDFSSFSNN